MDRFATNYILVEALLDNYNLGIINTEEATEQLQLIVDDANIDALSDVVSDDFNNEEDFEYIAEKVKTWLSNTSHYGIK